MKFPVIVNFNVETPRGNMVNRGVFDFYYKDIHSFVNGRNNNTLVTFTNGHMYNFQIPFDDMYRIYSMQHNVHEEFKEEVDMYKKHNMMFLVDKLIEDKDGDNDVSESTN